MTLFVQFDPEKQPRCKVELHAHLDGSVRLTTVWELAQKKGIQLPAASLDDLYTACRIKNPSTLANFLKPFRMFMLVIAGDAEAIERIAYEFCEDAVKQGVLYSEVRHCPHLLSTCCGSFSPESIDKPLTARDVVMSVNRGLARGAADFKLTVRSILCCFRSRPEWSQEILDLCIEFRDHGVVGIDIAGDESQGVATDVEVDVFARAVEEGIHRTVHAAEAGPADNVATAVRDLSAERIGHGYHVLDNEEIYTMAKQWGVHFETCPYSSYLTGSVPLNCQKHPIVRFAEDNVNFSINRDDPTVIQRTFDEEYQLLRCLGLKEVHIIRANLNAMRNSFLPEDQKNILWQQLLRVYGLEPEGNDQPELEISHLPPKAMSGKGDF